MPSCPDPGPKALRLVLTTGPDPGPDPNPNPNPNPDQVAHFKMRFTDADLDGDGLLTLEEVLPSRPVVEEVLPPTYYEHPSPTTLAVPLSRCTPWSPS